MASTPNPIQNDEAGASSNSPQPQRVPGGEPSPVADGSQQVWTRRRVLGWCAVGVASAASAGGWAALTWKENAQAQARAAELTQHAALFCFAGHSEAHLHVGNALAASRSFAPALLLRACLELEASRWDAARKTLARDGLSGTPEAAVLLELAGRRPGAPDWRHAFFDAWRAAGSPNLEESTLLPAPLASNVVFDQPSDNRQEADDAQRFALEALLLSGREPAKASWFSEQVRTSASVPLLLALHWQLAELMSASPLRDSLLSDVKQRLQQLAGASPPSLVLALFSFLEDRPASAPFQRGDLEALERLLRIPEWKLTSNQQHFQQMHARFGGLLLAPGRHAWRLVLLAQGLHLGFALLRRVQASKDHLSDDDQRWMGRLLWEVGERLRKQRSSTELDLAARMQITSSELTRYVPNKEDAVDRWVELRIWEEAVSRAGCDRWPLYSLQEECFAVRARDEQVWMTAFAGVGELP